MMQLAASSLGGNARSNMVRQGNDLCLRVPGREVKLRRSSKRLKPTLERRKVLAMTLNRAPFDAIVAGEKKTEYRENKAFWRKRLIGIKYEEVHFRNGY
jgi:hypothetical protein